MRIRVSRAVLVRFLLGVLALVISTACGSGSGCSGCQMQKIPGGFPLNKKVDNAIQVRLAQGGINFVEQNFESLIKTLVPGGLSFAIPKSCGTSQRICCTGPACNATIALDKTGCPLCGVTLEPTPKSSLKLKLKAKVKTTKLKIEMKIWLLGWMGCDMAFNSASNSPPHVGIDGVVDFVVQASQANKLAINMTSSTLSDFQVNDAKLSGGALCSVGDFLKNLPLIKDMVRKEIEKQLKGTLTSTLNGMLKGFPMGQEGRVDMGAFMTSFSPRTTGKLDMFFWAGGHAKAENSGMSVGVMGGFQPAAHNNCVLYRAPPAKTAIPWSKTFTGNARPDGKPFHVGIGVHRMALDAAAWSMYSSGAMCLDVGTDTVPQISSSMFALLLSSVNDLTGGQNVPMLLSIRPRYAPTITLGKGTYTIGSDKNPVITEPLLYLQSKDFGIDLFLLVEGRMVRLFTVVTDLKVPMLLYADAKGKLQPMLGDLKKALTNIRLENYDLIAEDPKKVTSLLPTLIALASGSVSSAIQPIDLPSVQGLKLILDGGSITSVDKNSAGGYDTLAIFAKLGVAKAGTTTPSPSVDTEADVEQVDVPPTAAFRIGPGFDPWKGPRVVLRLRAKVPADMAQLPVEYSYRVDDGFFGPWSRSSRLEVQDPRFWLQGKHTVEVMARVAGRHLTTDPTPVRIPVLIDTVAPRVTLVRAGNGVRAAVKDMVSKDSEVELSWSIDDGPFGAWGGVRSVMAAEDSKVAVRVRDRAGNVGLASTLTMATGFEPAEPQLPETGGCSVGAGGGAGMLTLLLLGFLGLAARRRQD